jgi:hypothetical protein
VVRPFGTGVGIKAADGVQESLPVEAGRSNARATIAMPDATKYTQNNPGTNRIKGPGPRPDDVAQDDGQ